MNNPWYLIMIDTGSFFSVGKNRSLLLAAMALARSCRFNILVVPS